jgi:hypothetical protein
MSVPSIDLGLHQGSKLGGAGRGGNEALLLQEVFRVGQV